jgi:NAD(P)-dependent dehydrogenase (short-subunit alcohol dehydrogenase family)
MEINGVAAVVTGGGSGLGAATARTLAKRGAKVATLDLNEAGAKDIASDIGGVGLYCDVAQEGSAIAALDAAERAHGPARILINCAGVGGGMRTVGKKGPHALDMFVRTITINLIGTFNMIRLVAARMVGLDPLGEERGVIINTSSVAAYDGQIGQAAYSASKNGIVGMTLPIARDLSQSAIRVNTIAPGLFMTALLQDLTEEQIKSLGAQVPFPPRPGRPDEFAELAAHIVSNTMLNGETIRLDGAIRMGPR